MAVRPDPDVRREYPRIAPRLVLLVLCVVFSGYFVSAFTYVLAGTTALHTLLMAAATLLAIAFLQFRIISNPNADVRGRAGLIALLVHGVLSFGGLAVFGQGWTTMVSLFAGSAVLVLRPAIAWPVFVTVCVAAGAAQWRFNHDLAHVAYTANIVMVTGLVVYALSRLRSLVEELDKARSALAGTAVTQERLRFARDLHNLLGYRLSAITLKTEVVHRMMAGRADEARQELSGVIEVSRQALADVRSVASSYRELSLDDELSSARSVLDAAGLAVTVEAQRTGDASPKVRTLLATVLREGVTNVLQHSKAEHCAITVSPAGDAVVIDIVNDGVPPGRAAEHGNGIGTLAGRVEALGGTLTAGPRADGTYRLRAEVPARSSGPAESWEPAPPATRRRAPRIAPRLATLLTAVLFIGYTTGALTLVWHSGLPEPSMFLAGAGVVCSLVLVLGYFGRPDIEVSSRLGYGLLAAMFVLTYTPILVFGSPWLGMPGFLAGVALLVLPPRTGVVAFAAIVVSVGLLYTFEPGGGDLVSSAYGFISTTNIGLVVWAITRLRAMVSQLHDARSELAELAVTKERLRFARDLHDLLGFSLSAITLKSELSRRLIGKDDERARQELTEILQISRQALADVRAVASSYRELSLATETESARALLAAADIEVSMNLDQCELSQEVRTTLATVLREGVTNLLRHSKAEHCEISLVRGGDRLTMVIVNDGLTGHREPAASAAGGNGIDNLTARIADIGGTLEAGAISPDTYRLQAEIPLSR
ncbi:sensor histidine kinase [Nocardia sp. NRRL S-836]|uniref:sensor histidine kinase n=1 Tax=Nocardia sp. NRRL S-836 TaxID=1519492 RepID=UPI000A7223DD|nr:histidine kinase [Nocardia sp. NRRL S-836]